MRLALALVALLASYGIADALCIVPQPGSAVMTAVDAKIGAGGGVLVEALTHTDTPGTAADAINNKWRFSDGTKDFEPVLETLAPGLVVYRPPAGVTGTVSLMDGRTLRGKVELTTDAPAQASAPEPAALALKSIKLMRGGSLLQIEGTFKTAAPAGTVAVVVYGVTKKGNVARSWGHIAGGAKSTVVAGTAGRCVSGIPGEVVSKAGDKVALAWVDGSGRLSKLSKPITVTRH